MSTPRFGALIGLALGAIWAVAGLDGAALAGFLSLVGYVIVLIREGRVDLTRFHKADPDGTSPSQPTFSEPTTTRTRTNLK
ncbi:MAG: hypothetical protein ACRDZO_06520 [Egibacteraceae bacterium]